MINPLNTPVILIMFSLSLYESAYRRESIRSYFIIFCLKLIASGSHHRAKSLLANIETEFGRMSRLTGC
ncbi:hypothetical protein MNBD_GAMMA12-826 [hydrothermal vent metagenome]|uniref:Uncharacterized protein n=1 Tax=hydrothermal vent metagenome TaxID=652676 RepID=A0A3B0YMQ6_9ZZZZ